jgi:23S rRNA (guanosine2251-2'-O)-methyltransferase
MNRVAGLHAVEALLERDPGRARRLLVCDARDDRRVRRIVELAREARVPIEPVERRQLDRLAEAHQGVVAECEPLVPAAEAEFEHRFERLPVPRLLLVLDGVTDPRNLGACLRTAEAAGVQAVLLPKRHSAPLNDAALKTAAGAAERLLLVAVVNLARRLEWLKARGTWLIGAAGDGAQAWHAIDLAADVALVVGAEGRGLRDLTRRTCDAVVSIPMAGDAQSLNVAVATGVLLFEAVRQRGLVRGAGG